MSRHLIQIIIAGTQIVGRAFVKALKQEIEASQQSARRLGPKPPQEKAENLKMGLTVEEAKQILDVATLSREEIDSRYKTLCEANKKTSFYLLSKIVRARERLESELENREKKSEL